MTWYEQAVEKLAVEKKSGKYDRYASIMKDAVYDALLNFCKQDEEFAQAVVQGGAFEDCMKTVAKNCGNGISDLDAFRRAVQFYFSGADVHLQMTINLRASVDAGRTDPLDAVSKAVVLNFEDFM